jgi:hypothetical protein
VLSAAQACDTTGSRKYQVQLLRPQYLGQLPEPIHPPCTVAALRIPAGRFGSSKPPSLLSLSNGTVIGGPRTDRPCCRDTKHPLADPPVKTSLPLGGAQVSRLGCASLRGPNWQVWTRAHSQGSLTGVLRPRAQVEGWRGLS